MARTTASTKPKKRTTNRGRGGRKASAPRRRPAGRKAAKRATKARTPRKTMRRRATKKPTARRGRVAGARRGGAKKRVAA